MHYEARALSCAPRMFMPSQPRQHATSHEMSRTMQDLSEREGENGGGCHLVNVLLFMSEYEWAEAAGLTILPTTR